MISNSRIVKPRVKMLDEKKKDKYWSLRIEILFRVILTAYFISSQVVIAYQTSLLSSIHLHQVPSSSSSLLQSLNLNSNTKPTTISTTATKTTTSNLNRRDLSARQTTVGTLYTDNRQQSAEQLARLQQARQQQTPSHQQQQSSEVCQVFGGESVAIVEIEESRSNDISQSTNPIELPISGSTDDEIELKIESETQKYFEIQGKQLRLIKPLDRDAVLKDNSTSQQILSPQISSIYLQISCADKRQSSSTTRKNVIIPVLVKVLDLNDNAPKFSSPIYTVQVDELTPINTILIDNIQAIDLDSANNGLIEYSLFSSDGDPIRREQQQQQQQQQQQPQRLIQRVVTQEPKQQTTMMSDDLVATTRAHTITTQRPSQTTTMSIMTTTDPSTSSKLDISTTVASLSSTGSAAISSSSSSKDVGEPEMGSTSADKPSIVRANSQHQQQQDKNQPTINLNNEPIINGPMEDGSEEEENDEALLASMNSTDTEMDGPESESAIRFDHRDHTKAFTRRLRRKKRSHNSNNVNNLFARRMLPLNSPQPFSGQSTASTTTTTSRNLWTNLMVGGDQSLDIPSSTAINNATPDNQGRFLNEFQTSTDTTSSSLSSSVIKGGGGGSGDVSLFSLDFVPNTNKPIIRLKGELDYETKRVHYLTIVATDRAQNREDRLSSKASIVIRIIDGDDQGPAFVLEQSGCATGTLPQTTTASPATAFVTGPSSSSITIPGDDTAILTGNIVAGSPSAIFHQNHFRGERKRRRILESLLPEQTSTTNISDDLDDNFQPNHSARPSPPKNFKITEENFDYSDATRMSTNNNDGESIPLSRATRISPFGLNNNSTNSLNESSNSTSRSRRIVASLADDLRHQQQQLQNSFDNNYGCLSNWPISYSGQAEYFSTIMSDDSDYVLRITPQAIKARDRDELNASIKYSFVNGTPDSFNQYFHINPLDASVKQIAPVDRNRINRFVIWVRAQEQTVKKLSSLAKLTIDVIPTDKNPPVLVPNSYSGFVEENSPVGTLVLTSGSISSGSGSGITNRSSLPMKISVIDLDQQQKGLINYEFDTTSDAFRVNRDGFVYVNRPQLDRDLPHQSVHIFQVTARQAGLISSKSISSPISINVTLLDLNDNAPSIANSSLIPLQIKADGKATRLLTTIKSTDLDEPQNSKVRFSIYHVSNNGRDRFRIHPDSGELEGLGKFSTGEQFSLTIQVQDDLSRLSQGILEVSVVPGPNSGGPKFIFNNNNNNNSDDSSTLSGSSTTTTTTTTTGYQVEINEGMPVNSAILQVRAVDPENDPITYNIIDGNVNGDFYINSKTGTIYVANRLDREEVSGYKLLVQARDSGGLATNRPVTITILDNNDENPTFQKTQYVFSCPEGSSSVGKIIGSVQALDADWGENGQVSYFDSSSTLQISSDGRALFAVDERTGDIRLLEAPDYETTKSHTLLVTARDNGENPRSTTTSVLIKILDIQDEEPYFERSFIELRVMENLAQHKLVQVRAIDPDSVAQIVYEIKYGDSSLFSVDPQTGLLSTTASGLDYEQSANHTIIIGTTDARLSEDQLRYVLSSRQPAAMESSSGSKSAICRIDILVGDINDVAPQFSSQPVPVRVQDTAHLGTMITRLIAEDHDGSEPNNQVRYELITQGAVDSRGSGSINHPPVVQLPPGDCAQLFMIDPTTGVVSVRSDLKQSSHSECNLMVRASDLGQQPHSLSSSVSVTIYIDHVAEMSPINMIAFADTSFTVEMEENPAPNSLVKVLTIINKPKLVPNYPMNCEIISGNEMGIFYVTENEQRDHCELRISKTSGSTSTNTLDYEVKQKYLLTIRLNTIGGGGGGGASGNGLSGGNGNGKGSGSLGRGANQLAQVNVNVLDKNDNKPLFGQPTRYGRLTQNRFLAAIPVDAPSETQLIQLRAQDLDSPQSNGLVSYELLNEGELGGRFRIDPLDGVVRTSRSVEDIPASLLPLHLRIMARDNPEQQQQQQQSNAATNDVDLSLASTAEVLVNLIEDRHRLTLVLRDSMSGRVLDSREELLAILQERSGLIAGFERAESLKIQRNGTIESDVTGTDFWFYLIEPGTFRLVSSDDSRVKSKLLDSRAQNSLKDVVAQTLNFHNVNIRLPYSIITGDPTLLGRTFSSSSSSSGSASSQTSRSHLNPFQFGSNSSFASSLITIAMIIAIFSAIVIVYQCGSRSSQRRARHQAALSAISAGFSSNGKAALAGQLPLPGHQYFQQNQQQSQGGGGGDYSTFNFPQIGPNAFLVGNGTGGGGQDNLAFSGSAFSTLPSSSGGGGGGKESLRPLHPTARDPYQAELDRQAAMLGKEYETQMLKMSVLFDDTQSFDEQTVADNLHLSQNPRHS